MATATQAQNKPSKKTPPKVQLFLWEGVDKKGNKIKGESSGQNLTLVKAELRKQGIVANKVRKKPTALFGQKKKKITPMNDRIVYSES